MAIFLILFILGVVNLVISISILSTLSDTHDDVLDIDRSFRRFLKRNRRVK